jgi:DNA-binding transcriptional regulator YiaG
MTNELEQAILAPEGGDIVARQTAQAKLLREAREELAQRARDLADAKDRMGLERMGLPSKRASELIAGQQFNSQDLADLLGVSLETLRNWTYDPATAQRAREMPLTAKLLLARILADKPKRKG